MSSNSDEQCILVLQGGGALGSYQAGAYEALAKTGWAPDWLAGISIGAINAAIIAGNVPERRVAKLRVFWEMVSSNLLYAPLVPGDMARMTFNALAASMVTLSGVPGFFVPRIPSPLFDVPGMRQGLSFYDTEPLRKTLEDLVDFDLINARKVRLSVGAVNVTSGNFAYFDNTECEIGPEHIMASGALPPGFPPIEINGEFYWDGGLASNTPLSYVLDIVHPKQDMCIFQVDLFSASGLMPKTIYDVLQREKDIRYSSRTRLNTDQMTRRHEALETVRRLLDKLPEDLRADPDAQYLAGLAVYEPAITIVHLIHRAAAYETQAKDYEFSRVAIDENWAAGQTDVHSTLNNPRWKNRKKRAWENRRPRPCRP